MSDFTTADAFNTIINQMTSLARDVQLQCDLRYAAEETRQAAEREAIELRASLFTAEMVRREVTALVQFIATGRKIEAIKAYRTLTNEGLKESKDAIETITSRFPISSAA